jgi:hypothetical protein
MDKVEAMTRHRVDLALKIATRSTDASPPQRGGLVSNMDTHMKKGFGTGVESNVAGGSSADEFTGRARRTAACRAGRRRCAMPGGRTAHRLARGA